MLNLAIVGSGYVGLVSGACFAELGHGVVCIDKDADVLAALRSGQSPIFEPGLEEMLARNAEAGRLGWSDDIAASVANADVIFITVDTPSRQDDGHADLDAVFAAAKEVAIHARDGAVVALKSTVPVGTSRTVATHLDRHSGTRKLHVASNPEFLREGVALDDFMAPDRVVIGAETPTARTMLSAIYRPLEARGTPIYHTDCASAEMIKYAANAFLAIKVSFINEVSELCDRVQADVADVAAGLGLDHRVGTAFLNPGPGIGGSCFPKDTRAIARIAQEHGFSLKIVEAAIESNDQHKARMVDKLRDLLGGSFIGKTVAVFGVTFKPDTDDMRESPSLMIIPQMQADGAQVRVVDPRGRRKGEALLPQVDWMEDPYTAAEGAELLVLLTEWQAFQDLDLSRLAKVMATPQLADLRNMYDPAAVAAAGFTGYDAVGRARRFTESPDQRVSGHGRSRAG